MMRKDAERDCSVTLRMSRGEHDMLTTLCEHYKISQSGLIRAAMCLSLPQLAEGMHKDKAKADKTED